MPCSEKSVTLDLRRKGAPATGRPRARPRASKAERRAAKADQRAAKAERRTGNNAARKHRQVAAAAPRHPPAPAASTAASASAPTAAAEWKVTHYAGLNTRSTPEIPTGNSYRNVVGTGLPRGSVIVALERAPGPDGDGQWVRHAAGWTMAFKKNSISGALRHYLEPTSDPEVIRPVDAAHARAVAAHAREKAERAREEAARRAAHLERVAAARALKAEKQAHPQRFCHAGTLVWKSLDRRDYDSCDLRHMDDAMFERRWQEWSCCHAVGRAAVGCKRRGPQRRPPKSAAKKA